MRTHEPNIRIDTSTLDVYLKSMVRPHAYIATDQSCRLIAFKNYPDITRQNLIDFIEHLTETDTGWVVSHD
jgi:hypothetical protein